MQGEPTESERRRWLRLSSGERLTLPRELAGSSDRARFARIAWAEMRRAGETAEAAARTYGANSREARTARARARSEQDDLLLALGLTREEVVARMSRRTGPGLDAIALIRY